LLLLVLALGVKVATTVEPPHYTIYKADSEVMKLVDESGSVGTMLKRLLQMPERPFVDVTFMSLSEGDALRQLLERSASTADYLQKLEAAGYRVERTKVVSAGRPH